MVWVGLGGVNDYAQYASALAAKRFRIELAAAIRADAVAEIGLGMVADVHLQIVPLAFLIADFPAGCADGQQSAQSFHS